MSGSGMVVYIHEENTPGVRDNDTTNFLWNIEKYVGAIGY